MKMTEAEWAVMEVLWTDREFALGEIVNALSNVKGWNKNTVHTYLSRMEKKGFVKIDRTSHKPYSAGISRESCAEDEREELLNKVYKGAAGDLIAAFLKESKISSDEIERLRKMLDDMEV